LLVWLRLALDASSLRGIFWSFFVMFLGHGYALAAGWDAILRDVKVGELLALDLNPALVFANGCEVEG